MKRLTEVWTNGQRIRAFTLVRAGDDDLRTYRTAWGVVYDWRVFTHGSTFLLREAVWTCATNERWTNDRPVEDVRDALLAWRRRARRDGFKEKGRYAGA